MEEEDRNETIEFLCYAEDSAGRAMAKELVDFYPETTVAQALDLLRRKFDREDFFSYLYITSHEQELLGIVSLKELILAPAHATMEELMQTSVVTVNLDDDQEKAAYLATRYDLSAIPVINEERHLMGIITGEDINEIIEEEYEEDLFKMAGLGEEQESFSQNPLKAAIYRFPWLITTVCGGLLSAWIIEHLRSAEYIWLLSFSPLILGLAGNIGIQTSTIIIRELSQSQFSKHLSARYFFTEIFTGCCLALFCGLTVGVIVSALRGSVLQGITVGLSLFSVIILSTCTSVCTPLIFNKLKIDPAIASGPLVTTMIDVCGLFIYFHCSYALLSNFIGT
jgi:magnesium transporter